MTDYSLPTHFNLAEYFLNLNSHLGSYLFPTIFLYQEVGIWRVFFFHVLGIISGMAEFLGTEATHGSCIWSRDLVTHTNKHAASP